jgi:hypothetical protein
MRYSRLGYWGLQAVAIGLLLVTAAIVMWVLPAKMVLLRTGLLAIALVATFAVGLLCYRSADEVILQTHKTCWFWGSMAGILVAALAMMAIFVGAMPVPDLLRSPLNRPDVFFADGIVFALLLEAAGFVVFWAYHNLARRG